jgi:hypothetical protein
VRRSWVVERAKYGRIAKEIEPAARVVTKDSRLWTVLWVIGAVLTLGLIALKMRLRTFLEDVATTIGPWQGYPRRLTELVRELVAHESRHTTQTTWFGWVLAPLVFFSRTARSIAGLPIFAAVYFLLPLPIGLAAGRFYLELDADRAAWRLGLREGWMTNGEVLLRAGQRAESLSRGIYLWAWPRSWAVRAYERMARTIVHEASR